MNSIHPTARISSLTRLGNYNQVGANVVIEGYKGEEGPIEIGDCNRIGANTRILVGTGGFKLGDWGVIHNDVLALGQGPKRIGHNFWVGQHALLDSTGGLEIGDGVRVGAYSQVWTHVASGELIEGCTLFASRPTVIEDEVWLVGSCIVGSGRKLGRRSVCLIGSNVTRDTIDGLVYAGNPAVLCEKIRAWKPVSLAEKLDMMEAWMLEFVASRPDTEVRRGSNWVTVTQSDYAAQLVFDAGGDLEVPYPSTHFNLTTKRYTKRLTELERDAYRFLYGHKARFVPATP